MKQILKKAGNYGTNTENTKACPLNNIREIP